MRKAKETPQTGKESDVMPAGENRIFALLTPWLLRSTANSVKLSDKQTESLLMFGKIMTESLLPQLSRYCADLYEIRNTMQALLDDNRYQEAHYALLLLYVGCNELALHDVVLAACNEKMLTPYMWGVMSAFEDYIYEQEKLYKKEETHAG